MAGIAWWGANWLENLPRQLWNESQRHLQLEATRIRDQFLATANFQPRIRIKNRVFFEQKSALAELSVLERPTVVEHEFVQTWAGSTKKLNLRGKFQVKSGFDLNERLEVIVRGSSADVFLPHAKILSVELVDLDLCTSNGWWNPITDTEQKQALVDLQNLARQQSLTLNLEAEENFRRRLLLTLGKGTAVHFGEAPASGDIPAFDGQDSKVR